MASRYPVPSDSREPPSIRSVLGFHPTGRVRVVGLGGIISASGGMR